MQRGRQKVDPSFWSGKRVLLTGHSGFKGGWASIWLKMMGAEICGLSLAPNTTPSLFEQADIAGLCAESHFHDVRDAGFVAALIKRFEPDIILHFAAQPLVSTGYEDPVSTFDTNVMGTINVMQAAIGLPSDAVCLIISSDKCYHNDGSGRPLREDDPFGGYDPYSASKGACEIAVTAWLSSFFADSKSPILASARAGNVIGGGDWSENRLLPDAARAFASKLPLKIRNPVATRPWQHVLEPLSGYFILVQSLSANKDLERRWNFGPIPPEHVNVRDVAMMARKSWGENAVVEFSQDQQDWKEASVLMLDSHAASQNLNWSPALGLEESIDWTMKWYRDFYQEQRSARSVTEDQIAEFDSRSIA